MPLLPASSVPFSKFRLLLFGVQAHTPPVILPLMKSVALPCICTLARMVPSDLAVTELVRKSAGSLKHPFPMMAGFSPPAPPPKNWELSKSRWGSAKKRDVAAGFFGGDAV